MIKLKACPFCGNPHLNIARHKFYDLSSTYGVKCEKCHAESWQFFKTEEEAVAAWNRREPRHGTWVEIPLEPFKPRYECSECGHETAVEYGEWVLSDYCPHCGAKMDISEGGETSGEEA